MSSLAASKLAGMGQGENPRHAGYLGGNRPSAKKVSGRSCSKNEIQIRVIEMMGMCTEMFIEHLLQKFCRLFSLFISLLILSAEQFYNKNRQIIS